MLLNRNAFGPWLVARAGDVWRAMQDVVVDQSSSLGGLDPGPLSRQGLMFIVRHMRVVHHREAHRRVAGGHLAPPVPGGTCSSPARCGS